MKEHIKILDFLRGVAALSVVLFHFGTVELPTISSNYLTEFLEYGKYGVQVFFVISGFIIPYSMMKSNYKISDYFNNLLRRFVRINPPSYVAILMSLILYFSAIFITGKPLDMDWPGFNLTAIIGNLTYSTPFLNTDWYNPVFWTLAIEFQFYFIIGLILPLLYKKNVFITCLIIILILALGLIKFDWFFSSSGFFILGILLFLNKERLVTKSIIVALFSITLIFCLYTTSIIPTIFGLITFLIILSGINVNNKATNYLGKISYSLYITHWVVGAISEIVIKRIVPLHQYPFGKIILLFVYTSIAVLFASIFYSYIEKPFIVYSNKLKKS